VTEIIYDVAAKEVELPIGNVHPDPFQPRVHPDTELAESIKTQGILQAIRVEPLQELEVECDHCQWSFIELAAEGGHFMIQDGERRFRGAIAAKQATVLAKVVPPATEAERLLKQLTSNTGKPLTVIEEAFAFKRIMEAQGWSQNELAKQLGRPRSLVGDRIRLVELNPIWLKLLETGRLQVSHAPILSQYREVPDEYQEKAAKNITDGQGWQMRRIQEEDAVIPVADFRKIARSAFADYITKLEDVRSYKGPVLELEEEYYSYSGGSTGMKLRKVKFAADITLWRPIKREAEKRRKKAQASMNSGSSGGDRQQRSAGIDRIAKLDLPRAAAGASYSRHYDRVYGESGWRDGLDPETFLANVKPDTLEKSVSSYDANVYSTDKKAIAAAEAKFEQRLNDVLTPALKKLRADIHAALGKYHVTGVGCRHLLPIDATRNPLLVFAQSLEIPGAENIIGEPNHYERRERAIREFVKSLTEDHASLLASALAAWRSGGIKLPDAEAERRKLGGALRGKRFELPTASDATATAKAESKAAGQQRGKEIAIARKNGAKAPAAENAEQFEEAIA
jgi:ParB/RepB/Spo0J family partition protein